MTDSTTTQDDEWPPLACTLPTPERPLRLTEFDSLFARNVTDVRRENGTRLVLTLTGGPQVASTAADLAARESGCCAFFVFDLHLTHEELALTVSTSERYADVLALRGDRAAALTGTST